jgi:hypothetical protein
MTQNVKREIERDGNRMLRKELKIFNAPLWSRMLMVALALLLVFGNSFAQIKHTPSDHRGDPNFRRKSNLDGNNLRASVFNFGFSGRTAARPDEFAYEWPKNTRRIYVALVAIWMGGEVTDKNGNVIQVVDFPTFRQSPQGRSWNLEPVPGFLNPDEKDKNLARSDLPASWPTAAQGGWRDKRNDPVDPGWVGSWNGFFGKNIFNADQEMFYRCSDDLYTRLPYLPDETDPKRGGLGLLMDVRAFAWSQVLINDAVFFIHDILNDGTKRIAKTSFLIWLADIVGNDSQDDQPFVDLQTSIAFLTDADRVGTEEFQGTPVGVASIKYLETPGNEVDGIDNDGDADAAENAKVLAQITNPNAIVPLFQAADFQPRSLKPGDKIVLIDSLTFERRVIAYPQNGGRVRTLGRFFDLPAPGITLVEDTTANLIDDDLDGLIDERETLHLKRFDEISRTVRPVRFINYLSFAPGDTIKRGFIVPGKAVKQSYTTVAPMIDESRDDGFDNDNDWSGRQDDVGLDGVEGTGDPGEGDGKPTSGSGTDFPGEPNIDKTDVSETDLIGLTSALQDPAFNINFNTVADDFIWRKFMTPGRFFIPRQTGEFDTYVSSGYFPMEPGQRQRMAISVALAGGGVTKNDDLLSAVEKQKQARNAYEADYQFAQAPLQPTVTAVAGDKRVTLYWDDAAEASVDRYILRIIGPAAARDFEGYRIYRATDPAFEDAKVVTDAAGNPILLRPLAQFDKKNGIKGLHPADIRGVKFDLGNDTGLLHSYTDTTVVNGQRYFYAVTAYDFGLQSANLLISPTETSIRIDVDPQGNIKLGQNVVVVRPEAPVAGYLPAGVTKLEHTSGSATGQIGFKIIDPRRVKDGHIYEIAFQDTIIRDRIPGRGLDTLTTKNFTVKDLTDGTIKLNQSKKFNQGDEVPLIDGVRLSFVNERRVELNEARSRWNKTEVYPYRFSPTFFLEVVGEQRPNDYQIIFGDVGIATSRDTVISSARVPLPGKRVNFKVVNAADGSAVPFAFGEVHGSDGRFSVNPSNANETDIIFFMEPATGNRLNFTWQVTLNLKAGGRNPQAGDTLYLFLRKPFLSRDVYRFTVRGARADNDSAKRALNRIRVVPNPYVAAERWEPLNPYSSGRGPREIHFINLPQKCTIRIFDVNGTLVRKLEHDSVLENGTAIWDVLSKDGLEISYGVYVFHIEAPGIGQKSGTFAIIK